MPALLRNSEIVEDAWQFSGDTGSAGPVALTLSDWQAAGQPPDAGVQLVPGEDASLLAGAVGSLALIAVHFSVFTDGRGFSLARELRDMGYLGELRARGHILPDQIHFLRRCGFDAFQPEDEARLPACLARLEQFSDHYQAATDQPLPLFRRRA